MILEAPGLDFGGSGLDFSRFWTSQTMPGGLSGWQTLCHRLVPRHWAIRRRKMAEILPSHRTSASNACAPMSWLRWARCSRSGVAGGVPPRGSSIRRPPKVCQQRARLISNWLCTITAGQSRHSFEQFVRAIRSEVFFPLSFPFPRSLGTTANPTPKGGKVCFFRIFGRFFRLPNRAGKMISKKHRKKCENQGFWLPKTHPKSFQNRCSKRHTFFRAFQQFFANF